MQLKRLIFNSVTSLLICTSTFAHGQWFVRSFAGLSQMSDTNASISNVVQQNGAVDIQLDSGFLAGLGAGYQFDSNWSAEVAWEYRSNDSDVNLTQRFAGNYASNIFFINGFYHFTGSDMWTPYLGAGLSWVQEIDIDLEQGNTEQSYSSDGDIGFQVFLGADYQLTDKLAWQTELRYGNITGIELQGENTTGSFADLDYKTISLQLGLAYRF